MKNKVNKLCTEGILLSICWLLPLLTGNIPLVGNMLCPMHIPVIFAGFILGPWYALFLGLAAPITRSLIFGVPIFYPNAICMAIELATYGVVTGLVYKLLSKSKIKKDLIIILITIITAQILGRCVWGLSRLVVGLFPNASSFTWTLFITSGFLNAWPGIILQWLIIPFLILICKKNHLIVSNQKINNINVSQSNNLSK